MYYKCEGSPCSSAILRGYPSSCIIPPSLDILHCNLFPMDLGYCNTRNDASAVIICSEQSSDFEDFVGRESCGLGT